MAKRGEASWASMGGADDMDLKERIKQDLPAIVVVFLVLPAALYIAGIGCPIKFATGVSCPGCGMTRAWAAFLSLNFEQAFAYHPLFFLAPLIPVLVFGGAFLPRKVFVGLLVVVAVAFIACWAIRMAASFGFEVAPFEFFDNNVVSVDKPVWLDAIERLFSSTGQG